MAAATQVMIEAAAHAELRSCEEHRRWKAGCQHDGGRTVNLSESLEAMLALSESTDDAGRDINAPDAECVFVDMRPSKFQELVAAAAALARRVEDAEIAEPAMQSGRLVSVIVRDGAHYKGQRLRLVPEAGQEVGK